MPTKQSDLTTSQRKIFSLDLIEKALPRLVFLRFASKKQDASKTAKGSSIQFSKFNDLDDSDDSSLEDGVAMAAEKLTDGTVDIALEEHGKPVEVTELAFRTNTFDIVSEAVVKLSKHYAKKIDRLIRNAVLLTTNFVYGKGKTSAASLTTADVFDTQIVKDAVEALETNDAPKFENEYYVCVATPHQLRSIKDDLAWINVNAYAQTRDIFKGEVGEYDGVRFVSTTQMPSLTAAQSQAKYGVNIPTYESVFFGENAFAFAEALPVEIRTNGVEDYGRKVGIAWYSILGTGLIDEDNVFLGLTA